MKNLMRKTVNRVILSVVLCVLAIGNAYAAPVETTTYYHTDVLGSVIAATDEAGELVWEKTYDSFGREVISNSSGDDLEEQAYTGKPYDDETGLVYLGQRYYDPELKRFIGMDPVPFNMGNLESFNPYIYANNNPYRYIDPDGRSSMEAMGGMGSLLSEVQVYKDDPQTFHTIRSIQNQGHKGTLLGAGIVLSGGGCIYSGYCGLILHGMGLGSFAASGDPIDLIGVGKVGSVATKGADKFVILGEGMGDIKTVAKQLQSQGVNAKWYQAWGKNFPANRPMNSEEMAAALSRNERWIRSKIKNGYKFFDIGIDATRSVRSPFYKLEQSIIKETGTKTTTLSRPN